MASLLGAMLIAQILVSGFSSLTKLRFKPALVIWTTGLIAAFCLALSFSGPQQERINSFLEVSSKALDLNNRGRGLESGFSGRTTTWQEVMSTMDGTDWITGKGFRTYDKTFPSRRNTMDNGYLLSMFEVGIPITLFILYLYLSALWRSVKTARRFPQLAVFATPVVVFILAILANSVLENHFFGIGTSFGLFTLALLGLREHDFVQDIPGDSPLWESAENPLHEQTFRSTSSVRDPRTLS
jgi:O-antigen ligase